MSETPVLEVEDLCKALGGKTILSDVSFSVRRGEMKVLIGPSVITSYSIHYTKLYERRTPRAASRCWSR